MLYTLPRLQGMVSFTSAQTESPPIPHVFYGYLFGEFSGSVAVFTHLLMALKHLDPLQNLLLNGLFLNIYILIKSSFISSTNSLTLSLSYEALNGSLSSATSSRITINSSIFLITSVIVA